MPVLQLTALNLVVNPGAIPCLLHNSITHSFRCRSSSPTAFTGYSFHVIEAAIVFANEIIVIFLFPLHAGLHRLYHLFTTVIHNGAHLER